MTTELKQAAQMVIEAYDEFAECDDYTSLLDLGVKMGKLRTAIQQAESEPVVSRNPFASRCYTMSESHLSGHRLIVGFEKLGDAQDAHEWVTRQGRGDFIHPAPSGLCDSKRLDYLQDRGATIDLIAGVAAFYPMRFRVGGLHSSANIDVRAAIDAAILAAFTAQKGGER